MKKLAGIVIATILFAGCSLNVVDCNQNSCIQGPCGVITEGESNLSILNYDIENIENTKLHFDNGEVSFTEYDVNNFQLYSCWETIASTTSINSLTFTDDGKPVTIPGNEIMVTLAQAIKPLYVLDLKRDTVNNVITYSAEINVYTPCDDTPC